MFLLGTQCALQTSFLYPQADLEGQGWARVSPSGWPTCVKDFYHQEYCSNTGYCWCGPLLCARNFTYYFEDLHHSLADLVAWLSPFYWRGNWVTAQFSTLDVITQPESSWAETAVQCSVPWAALIWQCHLWRNTVCASGWRPEQWGCTLHPLLCGERTEECQRWQPHSPWAPGTPMLLWVELRVIPKTAHDKQVSLEWSTVFWDPTWANAVRARSLHWPETGSRHWPCSESFWREKRKHTS